LEHFSLGEQSIRSKEGTIIIEMLLMSRGSSRGDPSKIISRKLNFKKSWKTNSFFVDVLLCEREREREPVCDEWVH
jgi:hypothetical protein